MFACLLIPDLPLAAALRAEPELRSRPLAIVEHRRDRATIVAGCLRGLTFAQAQTIQTDLVARPLSLEGMRSAQEALVDVGISVTPRVEDAAPGTAYLDLDGTEALFPTPRGLMTALEARLVDVGLEGVAIGIAPTRTAALLAARHRGGGHIVPPTDLQRFLGPLPLDLLDPSEELADRLTRWGLQTLGNLEKISRRSLGTRLGEEGVLLARRARGEDLKPFEPSLPRTRFEESTEPEYAVANLETLSFLMRGPLDRLTRRLRLRGLAIRELLLEMVLESGTTFARSVGTGAPTTEASVLTSLVRLALEKDPPSEPVERLRVIATPGSVEPAQLDLFLPPLPAPAELAVTVARLEALCGPGRVGAPQSADSHHPDASYVADFIDASRRRTDPPRTARSSGALALADADPDEMLGYGVAPSLPHPTLGLRSIRPPRAVRVWGEEGVPERVEAFDRNGPIGFVVHRAGPWRLFGEWWGEGCFARDYFDVELSDGGVYRIYRNLEDESWYADGLYD